MLRDPNPATWLPGVANSGPILALIRQYGNFNFSSTSGFDYDLTVRLPKQEGHEISASLIGTYTQKFDQQILTGGAITRMVGTAITQEVPRNRYALRLDWKKADWKAWTRWNHIDAMNVSSTATCLTSTSLQYTPLAAASLCQLGAEDTIDVGMSYTGIKNLIVAASMLNVKNSYNRSVGIPNIFNYWDLGTPGMLGRRMTVSLSYEFK